MTEKIIPLTQGQFAIIDADDFEKVSQFKWFAYRRNGGGCFYAKRNVPKVVSGKRTVESMQQFLMNPPKGFCVDHINHNGLDNRRENLRICTQRQNVRNKQKQAGTSSIYRGVSWNKHLGKWIAQIMVDYETKKLGCFIDEIEAAKVYDRAARQYFDEFAQVNFTG